MIDLFVPGSISVPYFGQIGGLTTLFGWGSLVLVLVLSVFLMMPVASAFTAFFLDEVADAVEERHYPGLPPAPGTGLVDALIDTLGFLGLLLVVNLISLALWPFAGPLMPVGVLGDQRLSAGARVFHPGRRPPPWAGRGRWTCGGSFAGQVWFAGALMAAPLAFPLVNLLVPVLGVATFTHMFHRLNRG